MSEEKNLESRSKKIKLIIIVIFSILVISFSIFLSSGYSEKKSQLLQNQVGNIKQQVEEQINQSITVSLQDKKPDPSIHNPLTKINPRYSFLNISQDEVAYIAHDGTMGAIGNITLRTTNEGYGFFNYLGDTANHILLGWFDNLNVSSTANASQFFQNGNSVIDSVSAVWNQSGTNAFLNNPANNVGIGTSSPTSKLTLVPTTNTGLEITRVAGLASINGTTDLVIEGKPIYLNPYSNGNVSLVTGGGNVGIGTTSPTSKLSITNNKPFEISAGETNVTLKLLETVAGVRSVLQFGATADNGGTANIGNIMFDAGATGSVANNLLILSAEGQSTLREDLVITGAGNVGIGTTSPAQTLDVRGQGNFSGIIWYNNNTMVNNTINNFSITIQQLYNTTALQMAQLINTTANIGMLYNSTALQIAQLINTSANIQNLMNATISQIANVSGGVVLINSTTMTTNFTSFNVTGIPSGCKSLKINVLGNASNAGNNYLVITFNGDNTANFYQQGAQSTGTFTAATYANIDLTGKRDTMNSRVPFGFQMEVQNGANMPKQFSWTGSYPTAASSTVDGSVSGQGIYLGYNEISSVELWLNKTTVQGEVAKGNINVWCVR